MVDFVQKATCLKRELDAFSHTLRSTPDEATHQRAAEQLQKTLHQVEALAEDPGPLWEYLSEAQRWGYLKLVSYVGTATHELKVFHKNRLQSWSFDIVPPWSQAKPFSTRGDYAASA